MNLIEFTQKLLRIQSITPRDMGCFDLIEPELKELGFSTKRINYLNVENLYAEIGSGENFCFLGHTDVVPTGPVESWSCDPFAAEIKENVITARGAADMKSSISAFLFALKDIDLSKNRKKISILLTSNEEGDAKDGTIEKVLDELKQNNNAINYCLAGEPSSKNELGDTVRIGRRGSLSGSLTIVGKQGHVAYPQKVLSPILEAGPIINELNQIIWDAGNEFFDPTSFQISNIEAGTGATNVVPGSLKMLFNFRFSPESTEESLRKRFVEVLEKSKCEFEIEWTLNAQPYLTTKTEFLSIIQAALKKVNGKVAEVNNGGGTSDGRWISPTGSEVIELGPRNKTIHQIDEKISLDDLKQLQEIYHQILVETNYKAS